MSHRPDHSLLQRLSCHVPPCACLPPRFRKPATLLERIVRGVTLGAALALASVGSASAQGITFGASDPLSATQAYIPDASVAADGTVVVDWTIEPGHYLYRDKTSLSLAADGVAIALDSPVMPEALIEVDAFFGESAVYRGPTRMSTRPTDPIEEATTAVLSIEYQGCADIGLCYPPTTVTRTIELNASASIPSRALAPPRGANTGGLFADLDRPAEQSVSSSPTTIGASSGSLFGSAADATLLRPEEAYLPMALSASTSQIELFWTIEDGYYLYRDKFAHHLDAADAPLAIIERSDGVLEHDAFFGDVYVNRGEARTVLALDEPLKVGDSGTLTVAYQGCADIGVCFPPSTIDVPYLIDTVGATAASAANVIAVAAADTTTPPPSSGAGSGLVSEQDRLSGLLANSSLWLSVVTFLGLGVLLAFTPCVLPMIPILSSLIIGQRNADGSAISGGRAFRLSLVYVLVMASTYAVAGVLVALSGQNVQIWLQNPVVLSLFAALFVVFAFAMFGLFEFQMPRALQSRLTQASNAQQGGGYRSVVTMGFLSTLIVGPCVTAPLAGALLYIADTGDAWVGGAALFALGFGMGAPLLLIGTSAASIIPKAGTWMVRVKQSFGVLMLGMAIWMLSRFISPEATALLAGLLVLGTGIWLGAADRLDANPGGWDRTAKAAGLAVSIYGVAVLLGALAGGSSLTRPLAVYTGGGANGGNGSQEQAGLAFQRVKSSDDLDQVLASASAQGRAVMLDFYADWCISCKEMEHFTFTDEDVQNSLDGVLLVQADVTDNDDIDKALLDRFRLFAPPAIIFFDPAGREMPGARVVGFVPAKRFSEHVGTVLATTTAAR